VAEALGRPDLVAAANRTFVGAMHVTALSAGLVALAGAVLLALAFRARSAPAAASEREGISGPSRPARRRRQRPGDGADSVDEAELASPGPISATPRDR